MAPLGPDLAHRSVVWAYKVQSMFVLRRKMTDPRMRIVPVITPVALTLFMSVGI